MSGKLAEMGKYHIARKKIPSKDGPVAVRCWKGRGKMQAGRWRKRVGLAVCGKAEDRGDAGHGRVGCRAY